MMPPPILRWIERNPARRSGVRDPLLRLSEPAFPGRGGEGPRRVHRSRTPARLSSCLNNFPRAACILYSPRKFLGVPDSGVLVSDARPEPSAAQLIEPPRGVVEFARSRCPLRRRSFDLTGQPDNWFDLFQRVESEFPVGPYRASDLSKTLLGRASTTKTIAAQRRANYWKLSNLLGDFALFPELPAGRGSFGLSGARAPDARDRILRRLHAQRIYAPVHWRIDDVVPPRSSTPATSWRTA